MLELPASSSEADPEQNDILLEYEVVLPQHPLTWQPGQVLIVNRWVVTQRKL